ncbi:Smr/MutS family protein [Streptomyces sp. NBC_01477]|uniref:Smr/MutS family protein n=1 Tax=Streptomyces sp. NBC_01477 TaxID=2976015 RepID=UPI002E333749|nr:Smr/MutS family protein [Streptomyces sp. NBC_01477]
MRHSSVLHTESSSPYTAPAAPTALVLCGRGQRSGARPATTARPTSTHRKGRSPGRAGSCAPSPAAVRCDHTTRASEAITLLTLDLHPIFRNNRDLDVAVRQALFRAAATGVDVLQIIPGKGTGKLRDRVLASLAQTHIRKLYARVETDPDNAGRILVHLR